MKISIQVFVFIVFLGLLGCEKEPVPAGLLLSTVTYHQNVDQVRHFYYNNSGQLSSREYRFDNKVMDKLEYQYKDGLVNRIDFYTRKQYEDPSLYLENYLAFEYESNQLIQSIHYPENARYTYTYDQDGRLTKETTPSSLVKYAYDSKGNIAKSVSFVDGKEHWIFLYEYDDKRNPYYKLDPLNDNGLQLDFISYTSPNNLSKAIFINERKDTIYLKEYFYKYNDSNLPVESYELYTSESNGYERDTVNHNLYDYRVR